MAPTPQVTSLPGAGRAAARPGARFPASALILAGGRSSRFGVDKLDVYVGGRPLLRYALLAVASVCQEVVVVTAHGGTGPDRPLMAATEGIAVRVVQDTEAFGGPLIGVLEGIRAARYPLCLVAGGDMPLMRPELLARLLVIAGGDGRRSTRSVALRLDGAVQPLPMVLRRDEAPAVRAIVRAGRRALRDLHELLPIRIIEPAEWRPYDPEGTSFVDVDRIEDLVRWRDRFAGGPSS